MSLLGAIVNGGAIVAGAAVGMLLKKGLSEKMADTLMKGLGLCTLFIGISGSLKGENTLILILSMIIGTCSLQSGLVGDHSILYNKSVLDFKGRLHFWQEFYPRC